MSHLMDTDTFFRLSMQTYSLTVLVQYPSFSGASTICDTIYDGRSNGRLMNGDRRPADDRPTGQAGSLIQRRLPRTDRWFLNYGKKSLFVFVSLSDSQSHVPMAAAASFPTAQGPTEQTCLASRAFPRVRASASHASLAHRRPAVGRLPSSSRLRTDRYETTPI